MTDVEASGRRGCVWEGQFPLMGLWIGRTFLSLSMHSALTFLRCRACEQDHILQELAAPSQRWVNGGMSELVLKLILDMT